MGMEKREGRKREGRKREKRRKASEIRKIEDRYRVDQERVNFVLDQLETCGFLHGVQHVSNNTSIVIFDIAKF